LITLVEILEKMKKCGVGREFEGWMDGSVRREGLVMVRSILQIE